MFHKKKQALGLGNVRAQILKGPVPRWLQEPTGKNGLEGKLPAAKLLQILRPTIGISFFAATRPFRPCGVRQGESKSDKLSRNVARSL